MKPLLATLGVALAVFLMIYAFNDGQDHQCHWLKQHHYQTSRSYCGH